MSIAYGRTEYSIAEEYDISVADAREVIRKWFARMTNATAWINAVREMPLKGEIYETHTGRKRRFGLITNDNVKDIQNESVNFPIQSTASDTTLWSLIRLTEILHKRGLAKIICWVHDSIIVDCPMENAREVMQIMKRVMEDVDVVIPDTKGVTLTVDFKVGPSWGQSKKIKDIEKDPIPYINFDPNAPKEQAC